MSNDTIIGTFHKSDNGELLTSYFYSRDWDSSVLEVRKDSDGHYMPHSIRLTRLVPNQNVKMSIEGCENGFILTVNGKKTISERLHNLDDYIMIREEEITAIGDTPLEEFGFDTENVNNELAAHRDELAAERGE